MSKYTTAIAGFFLGIYTAIFGKKETPVVTIPQVDISEETVDHVITIVNNIKRVVDSPVTTTVAGLIPGTLDDNIVMLIKASLVPTLAGLTFVKQWVGGDHDVALNDILNKVHFSDDADKNALYHSLAARLIVVASDGKVTWSEAVSVIEIYFKNFFGLKQAA